MELFHDLDKAFDCAIKRFVRQKSDDPVYVYRARIARREFWAVLSSTEVKDSKVSIKNCFRAVGPGEELSNFKRRFKEQKQSKEYAEMRLKLKAIQSYRQYRKAQRKLEEMERGADAPEGLTKLDTTEA